MYNRKIKYNNDDDYCAMNRKKSLSAFFDELTLITAKEMEKSSANSKHSNGEKNNAKKEWKEREMERAISIQMGDRFVSSNKTMYKCCRNKAVYKLKN